MHNQFRINARHIRHTTSFASATRLIAFLLLTLVTLPLAAQPDPDSLHDEATPKTQAQLTLEDLRAFTDVFNQIRRNYVGEIDDKTLLDSAIRGMLEDLDPHSDYLPATDYEDLEDNSRGRYSGIGIDVQAENQRIVVRAVINDSPADQAGINPGDVITSINGRKVKGRLLPEAMDELLGEPGSELKLTVLTVEGQSRKLELQRQYLTIPALDFLMLSGNIGYFKIGFFHRESSIHMEQALDSIAADGSEMAALIIDLRGNPGGVLQPAVAIADGFLDEGVIVSTRGQNEAMQLEFSAHPGQWLPQIPLMILVDRGSASASEVLAGALQDHGRALVVGERTFGKGTVQSVLPLRNGGGIKLTTARYYTPSGRSIQAQGIQPDVTLDSEQLPGANDDRVREADLERHLNNTGDGDSEVVAGMAVASTAPADFPLDQALQALREEGILIDASGEDLVEDP